MHVLSGVALAFVLVTSASAEESAGGPKPGEVLNQTNWQKAEGLLPPEILKHYQLGEYVNPIVDWPTEVFNWPPDFVEASKRNEGRFGIDERGAVIDKATGKQPPFILGHPFPTIEASDPQAGVKILWNHLYRTWYFGNLHAESQVNWVATRALERRTDQDVNFFYYDGVPDSERSARGSKRHCGTDVALS